MFGEAVDATGVSPALFCKARKIDVGSERQSSSLKA